MNCRIPFLGVALLAVFLFLLQAFFIVNHRVIIPENDPTYYYSYVRSVVIDRDLNFENEYRHFKINNYEMSPIGYPINKYSFGFPLLILPFFALTHCLIAFFYNLGFDLITDGYSIPYYLAFCLGSMFYGLIGINLCFSFLRTYFTEKISLISLLIIIFTTNLFYYFAVEPFISELCSFFGVTLFFYLWNRSLTSGNRLYYFGIGLAAGLMISIRQQNAAFIVVVLIGSLWNRKSLCIVDLLKSISLAVSGLLLGLVPQVLVWYKVWGSWIVYSYGEESFIYKYHPKILQVLFSTRHGLISWHPIVIICLIGVLASIKTYPRIAILFFMGFLSQLYINSSWHCWWLGSSFGHRGFIACTLIFSFGLAYMLSQNIVKIQSSTFIILSGILGLWNMLLAVSYLSKMIPQDDYFFWSDFLGNLGRLPAHILHTISSF